VLNRISFLSARVLIKVFEISVGAYLEAVKRGWTLYRANMVLI